MHCVPFECVLLLQVEGAGCVAQWNISGVIVHFSTRNSLLNKVYPCNHFLKITDICIIHGVDCSVVTTSFQSGDKLSADAEPVDHIPSVTTTIPSLKTKRKPNVINF